MKMRVGWMLALVLGFVGNVIAATPRDAQEFFFDQTLGDFREELAAAREQGKQGIFIFFEMDECPFCQRMRETMLNQPEIQDYYKAHFLNFSVDIEGGIEITNFHGDTVTEKQFAFNEYRVRATPVLMFFDLDGKPIARHTGPTADAREFLWLGEYVAKGIHTNMPFAQYKRERRLAER